VRRRALSQGFSSVAISESKALTCGLGGALGGTRTPSLLIRSQMLYPLSYERSHCSILHSEPPRCVPETPRTPAAVGERLILNRCTPD
jgi:hypothetical protein